MTSKRQSGQSESRRRFVAATLCSLGLLAASRATSKAAMRARGSGPNPGLPLSSDGSREPVAGWLRELGEQIPGARALGERCLRERPAEASAEWLTRELLGDSLGTLHSSGSLDAARVAEHLRAARIADHRAGQLIVIDGWFVTRTEARLLALVALRAA